MVELTRHPCSASAAASFARLLHVHRSGDVGSPARQRIYERFKGRQNTRLVLLDSRTSGARSPNAARRRFTSCDLAASMADRLPRQTGGRRHQRVAAIANRRRLGRCPPPATTLVQHRRYRAVLSDDGGFQLHVSPHAATMTGIPQDGNLIQRTILRTVIDIDLPTSRRRSLSFAAWHAWDAARLFPSLSLVNTLAAATAAIRDGGFNIFQHRRVT